MAAPILDGLVLAALVGVTIMVLWPALTAGFVLVDDHEILSFTPGALADPELNHPPSVIDQIFVADAASGRVRPLYWAIRYGQSSLLDAHPVLWHTLYVSLGLASAFLVYAMCRFWGAARVPALLGALWLVLAAGVTSVWIRLGPQESLATTLLLAGCFSLSRSTQPRAWRGWIWLFSMCAVGATLTKESFALVPPALVGLWIVTSAFEPYDRADWRKKLLPLSAPIVSGLVVVVLAIATAVRSTQGSYGEVILTGGGTATGGATPMNLAILVSEGGIAFAMFVLGAALILIRGRGLSRRLALWGTGAITVAVLILPQLALYRGNPGFALGRYLLPAGLGLVGGFVAGASWLRQQKLSALLVFAEGLWCATLLFGALWTWHDAAVAAADSAMLAKLVRTIATSAPLNSTVAIAVDPALQQELAVSLPYHLAAQGRPDIDARLIVIQSSDPTEAAMTRGLVESYFPGRGDLDGHDCERLAAVVLFSDLQPAEAVAPCLNSGRFHIETFSEIVAPPAFAPGIVQTLFPATTVAYSVLEPD